MGQRVRLAVASALSCRPALLLLDEPTSGQDASQLADMMKNLYESVDAGAAVFSTHDVMMALLHSTRVILMADGRVTFDGAPEDAMPLLAPLDPWVEFCSAHNLGPQSPHHAAECLRD